MKYNEVLDMYALCSKNVSVTYVVWNRYDLCRKKHVYKKHMYISVYISIYKTKNNSNIDFKSFRGNSYSDISNQTTIGHTQYRWTIPWSYIFTVSDVCKYGVFLLLRTF